VLKVVVFFFLGLCLSWVVVGCQVNPPNYPQVSTVANTPTKTPYIWPTPTITPTFTATPTCPTTAFSSVALPARAILSSQGIQMGPSYNVNIDSYKSSLGAYGGSNIFSNGNLQAAGSINIGIQTTVNGTQFAGTPSSLEPASVPVVTSGDLTISGNYTFPAGDSYFGKLTLSGVGITVTAALGGQSRVWFDRLIVNCDGSTIGITNPNNLWFLGTCFGQVSLNGSDNSISAVFYNPNGPINDHSTDETFFGEWVGSWITLGGTNTSFHRDESL
jgi:hypothetical protein